MNENAIIDVIKIRKKKKQESTVFFFESTLIPILESLLSLSKDNFPYKKSM